jgi:uncharacterized protein Yka (UPF0111/DUF47 family)
VKLRQWFLPEVPDVLAMLEQQASLSVEYLSTLVAWAEGQPGASDRLRDAETRCGRCKRELWRALRVAFSTPLDPEDLYSLSFLVDDVLNAGRDLVRDTEVLDLGSPDAAGVEMATIVRDSVATLGQAFSAMVTDPARATELADDARRNVRRCEDVYRVAMRPVLAADDLRRLWATAERYRRFLELAHRVVRVSDRVWYAVVKER